MPIPPLALDATVPVLVFKIGRYILHHGTVGIVRSLVRLGVPVYAVVEDRFAPVAMSRYTAGAFVWETRGLDAEPLLAGLATIGDRLGRPTILVPTDDSAAAFIAEHADLLEKWFLFPRLPRELPRQLGNKKDLYFLCKRAAVPHPEAAFPYSTGDVYDFIERARFPLVVKAAEAWWLPQGARSVSPANTPRELIAIYRQAESSESPNLMCQEYIPQACAEDWIFHGYSNPQTGCLVAFTGKKLRSCPPFAGPTTLGVPVANEPLGQQTERLLKAITQASWTSIIAWTNGMASTSSSTSTRGSARFPDVRGSRRRRRGASAASGPHGKERWPITGRGRPHLHCGAL